MCAQQLDSIPCSILLHVFSEYVTHRIDANPTRIKEARQGLPARCVTVRLTGNSKEEAFVWRSMGWMELYPIYTALFR